MKAMKGTVPERTLTIELENAATRKGWVSTLVEVDDEEGGAR